VHVLQGEREVAAHNKSLCKFELVGLPPAPKGVPQIDVTFDIDSNGIVNVSARDMASKKEQTIVVTPSGGLTEREITEIIEDAERHAADDRKKGELFRIQARLEGLLDSNMRSFAEFGSLLDEEKRSTVKKIIDAARKALASASISECGASLEKLAEASAILTEVIMFHPSTNAPRGGSGSGEATGSGNSAAAS